jgi:hypothetical protein
MQRQQHQQRELLPTRRALPPWLAPNERGAVGAAAAALKAPAQDQRQHAQRTLLPTRRALPPWLARPQQPQQRAQQRQAEQRESPLSGGEQRGRRTRLLQQQHPRKREADAAAGVGLSTGQEVFFALLCLLGVGLLAFLGWKGMAWYQRSRRPGYVELQDTATFHRPWALA